MTPAMVSRTGKRPAFLWYPKDAITDNCRALSCEAYGFYIRLLEHSWINDGIPSDEDFLIDLAKNAFGISKYKFLKLWPKVKNFFREIDGVLINDRLEKERISEEDYRSKQQKRGQKGNIIRWGSRTVSDSTDISNPIFEQSPVRSFGDRQTVAAPSPFTRTRNIEERDPATTTDLPSAPQEPAVAAAGSPVPTETALEARPPDGYHNSLSLRCLKIGIQSPDEPLSSKIYRTHPTVDPDKFPLFEKQHSPALWLHKSTENIELAIIQTEHPELAVRKPSQLEKTHAEHMAWAAEYERKAAKA
jgi:uncharacterized protein YdaU (DUF1376 family)